MSWQTPPEQVVAAPPPQPPAPATWKPRGPAVLRTIAAAVLVPLVLLGIGFLDPPGLDFETLDVGLGVGYLAAAAVALGALGLILLAILAQARTRPPGPGVPDPGSGTMIAIALLLGLSALYLLFIPLAILVFVISLVLFAPAAITTLVCAVLAGLGLINARGGHTGPTQRTATLAATAAWASAAVVMPCAGGVFVLSLAG